jgi:hypothetical protein
LLVTLSRHYKKSPEDVTNEELKQYLYYARLAEALQKVSQNPAFLGAQTGAMSVFHTWGQSLTYHPHIHMLVPAGGLSEDGMEWIKAGKNFFLPVKVLSKGV